MDFAFALFSGLVVTGGIVLWDRLQRRTGTDFKDKDTIGAGSRTAGIVIEYARAFAIAAIRPVFCVNKSTNRLVSE